MVGTTSAPAPSGEATQTGAEYDDYFVRRVAQRVWELWQEELRRERERRGAKIRK